MLIAPTGRALDADRAAAELFRRPSRVTPTEAAAGHLRNERDVFDPLITPYLIEPADRLADRTYQGLVFVGPARTGKTFGLVLAGVYYVVTVAPGDMLIVHVSQDKARKFSRTDLERAIKHTPELQLRLSPRAKDDNTYDKFFRSGIVLGISWPSAGQLAGDTLRYVMLTDYDRPENTHNVDGEGSLWSQAFKRIETYMSRGKCIAESSPGEEYDDPTWEPATPHEAPPARGIASLYNGGTRARWYFRCQHKGCGQHFEAAPGLTCFAIPTLEELIEEAPKRDLMSLAEGFAKVACPHCGGLHEPHDKPALNAIRMDGKRIAGATWLHEGQTIADGRISGDPRRTNIASYWLGGVAAAYQPWIGMIHKYLQAVVAYARTGDETDLKSSSHMDQALPYLPQSVRRKRVPAELAARQEPSTQGVVPEGVRFLTAAFDVQKHAFVCEVFGWGVGLESWLVDRFKITASKRPEGERFAAIEPGSYPEDWHLLIDSLLRRTYQTEEAEEFRLSPLLVLGDSGGTEGVTMNAYAFWRHLRAEHAPLHQRCHLVKGTGNMNAPRVQLTHPDARARKDRVQGGRGDVPVLMINTNVLKDGVSGDIARAERGPGYVHLPQWVDVEFFAELSAETRTARGWVNEGRHPNEAFDLHVYNRAAACVLRAEAIDWNNPPEWALPIPEQAQRAKDRDKPPPPRPSGPRRNWVKQW
jgi:phage terminase large subunit GpA-like protein